MGRNRGEFVDVSKFKVGEEKKRKSGRRNVLGREER